MTDKSQTPAPAKTYVSPFKRIETRLDKIEDHIGGMEEYLSELNSSICRLMLTLQPVGDPFWVEVIPIKNHGPALQPQTADMYLHTLSSGSMTFDEYIPEDGRFENYDWDEIAAWALLPTPFRRKTK